MTVAAFIPEPTRALAPVGDWHPSRYTPTLSGTEDFTTDADRLLAPAGRVWSVADADEFMADPWQVWLLRHALETYPPDWPEVELRGQLRYKQVVISLARQNGKSLVAALLVLYFLLLHKRAPRVAGFASIDKQAKIVYDRVRYAVETNPALSNEIRTTGTRGIHHRTRPGLYDTYPAKEDSVQGEPFTAAIYDELHIGLQALWDAIVVGQRAQSNTMLVGITTAGDSDSELLMSLYEQGDAAIRGEDPRFGFFVWEAATDDLTEENVIAANPAVAGGRIPLESVMDEARRMWARKKSRPKVIRYTLNRFIEGAEDAWVSSAIFNALVGPALTGDEGEIVYGLDRTADWEHASITAGIRREGRLVVEYVATIENPDHELLVDICRRLAARGAATFAMPSDTLAKVGKELKESGHRVWILGATEMQTAASSAAAAITNRNVVHDGNKILRHQSARAKRRVTGDGWRVSRSLSVGNVDAVVSLVCVLFVLGLQLDPQIDLA